jgi:ubiquinone/menaquinone biosynthesis C-methylase UbiE
MQLNRNEILEQGHKAYAFLRSAAFSGEFQLLANFNRLLRTGHDPRQFPTDPNFRPFVLNDITQLFKEDARLFSQGICPWSLLLPESPLLHSRRLANILVNSLQMSRLKKERKTSVEESEQEGVPDYYRRNFHWQTGGYLKEDSGKLYDHQVEILFKGTGAAMRRLLMNPLHDYLKNKLNSQRILEVASGTGLAAQEVHQSFPGHSLTVTDLSTPYLNLARRRLKDSSVDFVKALAEDLPFKDGSFDVVYSAFLFHELPRGIREKAMEEFKRVLRPGGLLIVLDSIQKNEVPEYQWALDAFPKEYHEPFYKDYSLWPVTDAFEKYGFTQVKQSRGFFSKCVSAIKSA